jgi:hypothetical protein
VPSAGRSSRQAARSCWALLCCVLLVVPPHTLLWVTWGGWVFASCKFRHRRSAPQFRGCNTSTSCGCASIGQAGCRTRDSGGNRGYRVATKLVGPLEPRGPKGRRCAQASFASHMACSACAHQFNAMPSAACTAAALLPSRLHPPTGRQHRPHARHYAAVPALLPAAAAGVVCAKRAVGTRRISPYGCSWSSVTKPRFCNTRDSKKQRAATPRGPPCARFAGSSGMSWLSCSAGRGVSLPALRPPRAACCAAARNV